MEREAAELPRFRMFKGMKPEDILNDWPDKDKVAEARKEAAKWMQENWQQADQLLGKFLERSADSTQRKAAMDELRTLSEERHRNWGAMHFKASPIWLKLPMLS